LGQKPTLPARLVRQLFSGADILDPVRGSSIAHDSALRRSDRSSALNMNHGLYGELSPDGSISMIDGDLASSEASVARGAHSFRWRDRWFTHCITPADSATLDRGHAGGGTIMDIYTFTVEIVKAITSMIAAFALPVALIVCVWLFKEKLAMLLLAFRVRHKDWEASFRWDKAEAEAKKLPSGPFDPETQPTPEEKNRFEQIAKIAPREAILEVGTQLEEAVRSYASTKGFAHYSRRYALLIRLLRSKKLIDANTSALLDDLQNIGNAAAHNLSDPTEMEAFRYKKLADQLIRHFDGLTGVAKMIALKPRAP
jgi:hypothetical protein